MSLIYGLGFFRKKKKKVTKTSQPLLSDLVLSYVH